LQRWYLRKPQGGGEIKPQMAQIFRLLGVAVIKKR
jgi:hypothetical protein